MAARQEKNQKECVDSLAALRVQQEVVWAKQGEQALLERRDLVNKLTSNPRAVQEELALSQREAVIAEQVVIAELLAEGAEDNAVLLHWLACALQLAAPAAMAGKTQPTLETSAVADGGAVISFEVLDGAVPEAHGQFESSAAKDVREGGEEEDLDLTERHRDRARREEQLRIQPWAAPGGPRLHGPLARRRGRLRHLPGHRRQRSCTGARGAAQGRRRGSSRGESLGGGIGEEGEQGGEGGAAREEAQGSREQVRREQWRREQGGKSSAGGTAAEEGAGPRRLEASEAATVAFAWPPLPSSPPRRQTPSPPPPLASDPLPPSAPPLD